ncbi:unnamed protein product [Candida verbasci]|uniref:G-patch domain-containing protein n=1 Tax=Candida verbasci TaxID=1227364 RepID=A0A9W4TYE6_9ASCO|nr:unnamed protein product [Candida verbasci]
MKRNLNVIQSNIKHERPKKKQLRKSIFETEESEDYEISKKKPPKKAFEKPAENECESESDEDYMSFKVEEEEERVKPKAAEKNSIHKSLFESSTKSIGLRMMEKIGFKVGDTLGAKNSSEAIKEPIQLRTTLGKGTNESAKYTDEQVSELKSQKISDVKKIHHIKEVKKLMKLCFDMSGDFEKDNVEKVNELWRPYELYIESVEESKKIQSEELKYKNLNTFNFEDHINNIDDTRDRLLTYLRDEHCFCYYCGSTYENLDDLEKNCPGLNREEHESKGCNT